MQGRNFFFYLWSIAFILPIFSLQAQVEKVNEKGEKIIEHANGSSVHYKKDASEETINIPLVNRISNMSDNETRKLAINKMRVAQNIYKGRKKTTREFTMRRIKLEKKLDRLKKSKKEVSIEMGKTKNELKQIKYLEKDSKKTEKLTEKEVLKLAKIVKLNGKKRRKVLVKLYQPEKFLEPIKSMDSVVLKEKKVKKEDKKPNILEKQAEISPSISSKKEEKIVTNESKKKEKERKMKNEEIAKSKENKIATKPSENIKQTENKSETSPKKVFVVYKEAEDVSLNPPKPPCVLAFSGEDEFTGKIRKDVASQLLFAHTDEELRPYMNGKDYLTCHAYVTSLAGGYQYLTLDITIASRNAQKEYGLINKGSILTIKTLNDRTIKLQATKSDFGIYNAREEAFKYKASYRISGSGLKLLKKSEIDKVRVVWSSGYVDYEVYEVDFFINQLNCLSNGK